MENPLCRLRRLHPEGGRHRWPGKASSAVALAWALRVPTALVFLHTTPQNHSGEPREHPLPPALHPLGPGGPFRGIGPGAGRRPPAGGLRQPRPGPHAAGANHPFGRGPERRSHRHRRPQPVVESAGRRAAQHPDRPSPARQPQPGRQPRAAGAGRGTEPGARGGQRPAGHAGRGRHPPALHRQRPGARAGGRQHLQQRHRAGHAELVARLLWPARRRAAGRPGPGPCRPSRCSRRRQHPGRPGGPQLCGPGPAGGPARRGCAGAGATRGTTQAHPGTHGRRPGQPGRADPGPGRRARCPHPDRGTGRANHPGPPPTGRADRAGARCLACADAPAHHAAVHGRARGAGRRPAGPPP